MIFEGQIRGYVKLSIKLYRTQCNFKIIFPPVLQKHVFIASSFHFFSCLNCMFFMWWNIFLFILHVFRHIQLHLYALDNINGMSLLWTYGLILVRWLYVQCITSVRQLKFDLSSLKRLYLVCTFFQTRNKSTGFWTSFQIVNEIKLMIIAPHYN